MLTLCLDGACFPKTNHSASDIAHIMHVGGRVLCWLVYIRPPLDEWAGMGGVTLVKL